MKPRVTLRGRLERLLLLILKHEITETAVIFCNTLGGFHFFFFENSGKEGGRLTAQTYLQRKTHKCPINPLTIMKY